jgi:N-acetylglutamate synthase-like GNAT family acetyltransferase
VRTASSDDVVGLAQLLTRTFIDDPIERWCLACDDFGALLELQSLEVVGKLVARDLLWVLDDLSGVSAWFPPGAALDDEAIDAVVNPVLAAQGGQPERLTNFWGWVADHHPSFPHWYVDLMAIDPARRGSGAGTLLLTHGLARTDSLGGPTFLVTGSPTTVPWYERHGFAVTAHDDAPDGGPHVWFMLRLPPG